MKTYQYKSDEEKSIDLPDWIFQGTADLFYQMTGKDKEKAGEYIENRSVDAAVLVLKALDFKCPEGFAVASGMTGHRLVGEDITWLAIARAKAIWTRDNQDAFSGRRRCEIEIPDTEACDALVDILNIEIERLHPAAERAYRSSCIGYAMGGPKNLHLKLNNLPFEVYY